MRNPHPDPRPRDLCCQCAIPGEHTGHPMADHTRRGPYGLGCTMCNCAEFLPYRTDCFACGKELPPNDPLGVCSLECEGRSDRSSTWLFGRLFARS
jgi:Vertebrate endogenous opioids neuropeptide